MSLAILLALIGLVVWLVWHTYRREKARIKSILRDFQEIRKPGPPREKAITLEQDPKTGEYRPVKED